MCLHKSDNQNPVNNACKKICVSTLSILHKHINIQLPIGKEIGQSHIVKSTDPDTWTVKGLLSHNLYASKFSTLRKAVCNSRHLKKYIL